MTYGRWDCEARVLYVDETHHASDREVRATVLHEMVHPVLGRGGHHAPFWTQLEYLLSRRAPITVGFPELNERGSHLTIIPSRFRRCRRLFRPVYERQQRAIARLPVQTTLTPGDIEGECEDRAIEGAPWRAIWSYQARTYASPWTAMCCRGPSPYQRAARRGYVRGRRFFLQGTRAAAGPAARRAFEPDSC